MTKKHRWVTFAALVVILISCSTSADLKDERVYRRQYFFRPGAEYYSYIDLQPLRPLIRALTRTLSVAQRMQVQMLSERTNRILSYRLDNFLYSLLEGSYPKGIIDNLLYRHPEWLDLPSDIDGYRHYSASLEIGLPESNVIYATTGSLKEAYEASPVASETFLPAYVVEAMMKRPFVIYYPRGNSIFIKDNPNFASLPPFELMLTMFLQDAKSYRIHAEFTLASNAMAEDFVPSLTSVLDWYRSYYTQWGDLLDLLQIDVQGKQVYVSATFSEQDMVRMCSDAVKIAMANLMSGNYDDSIVTNPSSILRE